jgi:hypothetical protein
MPQQRRVGRMQQDRRAGAIGELGRGVDVVVVPVGAQDADHPTTVDRGHDRVGVVRGVDDQDIVLVAQEPDVVLHVPGAAVEGERPGRHDPVDPTVDASLHRCRHPAAPSPG